MSTEQITLNFDGQRNTQSQKILRWLQAGNRISPLQALNMFGCFRLGARCYDLKKAGYPVRSEMVTVNGKRVAEYRLEA